MISSKYAKTFVELCSCMLLCFSSRTVLVRNKDTITILLLLIVITFVRLLLLLLLLLAIACVLLLFAVWKSEDSRVFFRTCRACKQRRPVRPMSLLLLLKEVALRRIDRIMRFALEHVLLLLSQLLMLATFIENRWLGVGWGEFVPSMMNGWRRINNFVPMN